MKEKERQLRPQMNLIFYKFIYILDIYKISKMYVLISQNEFNSIVLIYVLIKEVNNSQFSVVVAIVIVLVRKFI